MFLYAFSIFGDDGEGLIKSSVSWIQTKHLELYLCLYHDMYLCLYQELYLFLYVFFSICGDEGEGLIKCRVFRDPDNTSGGS